MYVCVCAYGGQKGTSDLLKPEVQAVTELCDLGAENWTLVLWKKNKRS